MKFELSRCQKTQWLPRLFICKEMTAIGTKRYVKQLGVNNQRWNRNVSAGKLFVVNCLEA
jgi:hypothetical protein